MTDPRNFYFPDATPADFESEGFKAMASSTMEDGAVPSWQCRLCGDDLNYCGHDEPWTRTNE